MLPHRWVKETLAWLNQCRRLSKDNEEISTISETFVYVVITCLMLKRLTAKKFSNKLSEEIPVAYETTVMAGGIRFYLIGRSAYPTGTVVHKFQTQMINARRKIASAIAVITATPLNLNNRQELVLKWCFNPLMNQRPHTIMNVTRVLNATLAGLRTADLKIREPDPAAIAAGAEGYVTVIGPFRGDIHTHFNLNADRTLNNIIHEATHKFARTVDRGYLANGLDGFVQLALQHNIHGNSPITNANGLVNADSYSAFAVNLT